MTHTKSRIIIAMVASLASAPALAQELPRLTIEQAVELGRQSNPTLARARVGVSAAEAGLLAGYGAFLPTLSATATWFASRQTAVTGTNDFGETITRPEATTFRSSTASQGLSSGLTVFDGLQNINNLNAARSDVDAAEAAVDGQEIAVDAEVRRRFYGAVRSEKLIAVERQLLEAANERLEANERLFRVAAADQVDVLGAQVDLAQAQQALEQAQGNAHKDRLLVLQQIGILDETLDFEVVGDFPAVFDPARLVAEQLVVAGLQRNPIMTQRGAETDAASRRASAARGTRLPTVSLGAGFSRSQQGQDYGAFFDLNPRNRNMNLQLQVTLPIFQGFRTSQQVAQANASFYQAEEDRRTAHLQVEQGVRSALIDLHNAYQGLTIQRRSTELSRQRVELAREQYRLAAMSFTELQQIIQGAANDERQLVQAEYNFAVARVSLEEQVGGPLDQVGR